MNHFKCTRYLLNKNLIFIRYILIGFFLKKTIKYKRKFE